MNAPKLTSTHALIRWGQTERAVFHSLLKKITAELPQPTRS